MSGESSNEPEFTIKPNITHKVGLASGEELQVNGCYDSLHYWAPLDVWWLRYVSEEDSMVYMVVLEEEGAEKLITGTDVPMVYRESIFEREHDNLIAILGNFVVDEAFDLDIDEEAIIREEGLTDE